MTVVYEAEDALLAVVADVNWAALEETMGLNTRTTDDLVRIGAAGQGAVHLEG